MEFETFNALLRSQTPGSKSVGEVMIARALLSFALARSAFPDLQGFELQSGKTPIVVTPYDAGILFFVDSGTGNEVQFYVTPETFDVDGDTALEFQAYRAFLNDIRQFPVPEDPAREVNRDVGPFSVQCSTDDMAKWMAIWQSWEHAHGV